ncbi:tRNA (N(6)-L-threonylcarbamoyladenosine(37)-C(2))-methylthiotransferase MtaB [Terasakiella brassicae]|uniref:tRNA (N(6)-L-threonylcarbamoyladenosine(37)-C(2))-methylthiotransferase MtaB n=1 Tax=Terasakiella brassicae TaxID=1634917 RepID=A0A917C8E8_9PROT|nr:tRNA (N(6)-L-threonylcarbamoyladenosine(37)-C(2))-methylthiotransferase MtaB [Terasakiella brassicae]GGF72785.1 tRNA (N(6)-L-threonylcarbamoyladenosine(37)-C(2))-methylthiotransferase MtaB [Terasakiella brassicae]
MSEAKVVTLGCRLNTYESEVMRKNAREAGLENAIIINTCAVTGEAVRQARQTIRKMRKSDPDAKIIVTGCAAQIDPEAFAEMEEVDRVIGNKEKLEVESFLPERTELIEVTDIMQVRETANHLIDGFDGHTRAFIEVQQGCDHRCTFCIIPFGRGPNRSVSIGEIVDRVKNLVERGYKEVVLTGVDVTSYGPDLPGKPTFGQMVRRVLSNVPQLPRLRLSSLDPAAIDADLLEVIAREPRLMPHFHLSLQSGEDMILKRMKRRHTIADAIALCDKIRMLRPDAVFGADLIAGFPTETDEMFATTLETLDRCGITFAHVFPFSPREGTPAARMPQVPGAIRKQRAARIRALGEAALDDFMASRLNKTVSVLVEKNNAGHCEHYCPVQLTSAAEAGQIVSAKITGIQDGSLIGEIISHD